MGRCNLSADRYLRQTPQNKSHFSVYSRPVLWYNAPYESLHNLPEVPTATWNGPDAQARE